jgi:hypothetical protein
MMQAACIQESRPLLASIDIDAELYAIVDLIE